MAKPAQSALPEQHVHDGLASVRKDLDVGHFVAPKVQSFSFKDPDSARRVSCRAAMSTFSVSSSIT